MKHKNRVLAAFLLIIAYTSKADDVVAPIFTSSEKGKTFIRMRIEEILPLNEGITAIIAKGTFNGEIAAVEIHFGSTWRKPKIPQMPDPAYIGKATLINRGNETLVFAKAVASAWGEKAPRKVSPQDIEFTAMMHGSPAKMNAAPTWTQFIHGAMPSRSYVTVYFYLDLKEKMMQIQFRQESEYDEDYPARFLDLLTNG